jgi:hypothetical protein
LGPGAAIEFLDEILVNNFSRFLNFDHFCAIRKRLENGGDWFMRTVGQSHLGHRPDHSLGNTPFSNLKK